MDDQRVSDRELERAIGQTPCLCGDIDTWHARCYRGKSQEQITQAYKRAFRIARKALAARMESQANDVIAIAAKQSESA